MIGLSPCPGPDWNPNHSLKLKHVFLIRKAVLSDNFIENHPHSVLKYLPHIQIHNTNKPSRHKLRCGGVGRHVSGAGSPSLIWINGR